MKLIGRYLKATAFGSIIAGLPQYTLKVMESFVLEMKQLNFK